MLRVQRRCRRALCHTSCRWAALSLSLSQPRLEASLAAAQKQRSTQSGARTSLHECFQVRYHW
jgi:hypothetical protein